MDGCLRMANEGGPWTILTPKALSSACGQMWQTVAETTGIAYSDLRGCGFVERDGVELHLSESMEHDRTRDYAEMYLYVSDADALYAAWSASVVKGRFIPRTTRRMGCGSSPSLIVTEMHTVSDRRWCSHDQKAPRRDHRTGPAGRAGHQADPSNRTLG